MRPPHVPHPPPSTRPIHRALALATLCVGTWLPLAAQAATVDLVTNIEPASATAAQTYVPFDLRVRFANIVGTASNATGSVVLPAQLSNVQLTAASGNGAYCLAASSFAPVPTGATTGGETMSARFASLAVGQTCEYQLRVTPMAAGTAYPMKSTMQVGAGDTEERPDTNNSENPFTLTNTAVTLEIDKRITTPTTAQANGTLLVADPSNVGFEVHYRNTSTVAIALGGTSSQWIDWEGSYSAQIKPTASTFSGFSCTSSVAGSGICAALTQNTPAAGTDFYVFDSAFTNQVMQPGEDIKITYTRSYTPPSCGSAEMENTSTWNLDSSNITPQWSTNTADNTPQTGNARVVFALPANAACPPQPLVWKGSKSLQSVSGNKATYLLSIDLTDPSNSALTAPRDAMEFQLFDVVKLVYGATPIASPSGSAVMSMRWIACQKTGAVTADCMSELHIRGNNLDAQIDQPRFTPSSSIFIPMKTGVRAELTLELEYKTLPNFQCLQQTDANWNSVGFTVHKTDTTGNYVYDPAYQYSQDGTAVPILASSPYCVNLAVSKSVSPMLVKSPSDLITTTLTFRNNSATYGPKTIDQVVGTNLLGATYQLQSASCTTASGNATVPTGSLVGNVSTANNLFSVPITNMERGAVVVCTLTGYQTRAGSYRNPATIALGSPTGVLDDGTPVTVKDVLAQDDSAAVNYMAAGVQVTLAKAVSPTGAVKPGDTLTYTVTAANTLTDSANGTVVRDSLPAAMTDYSWTCTASGGASCPNAASGSGGKGGSAINDTIAIFPPGGKVVYTVTGTVNAGTTDTSISNTAYVDLPNSFASCGPDNTAGPCQATVTNPITTTTTGTSPAPIPSNTPWGLALLAVLMGGLAWRQQRALRR